MRKLVLLVAVVLFVFACSTQKKAVNVEQDANNQIANEEKVENSIEYGMKVFDDEFKSWYQTYKNPDLYRSLEYYSRWNKKYVSAWNSNVIRGRKESVFESAIGYKSGIDYGFDLNHELFYYFQYVENVLKIEIMKGGPNEVQL